MKQPKAAIKAFDVQRRNAKRRGIPFLLTFEEWWDWWQTDGRWEKRGLHRGGVVMARVGDIGPYAIGNIYCSTAVENIELGRRLTAAYAKAAETRHKMGGYAHLKTRADHPRCRPVVSPKGTFPSIALAAEANGLTAHYAQKLASRSMSGWRYADRAKWN